jgi:Domain of unknown function (DUF4838)/Glycosyl hydrolase family 67 N-terminus
MLRRVLVVAVVLTLVAACADARELKLKSLADWTIVVADDAIPSERYAAEEFAALAKQGLGIDLKVVSQPPAKDGNIFIGPGALPEDDKELLDAADLGEEGCYIGVTQKSIAIAGGRPRGTLYAVYEFWEEYCGVRFLTYDDTHIPEGLIAKTIPCGPHTYTPPFSFRWSYYSENTAHPDFAARLRCNKTTQDEKLGGNAKQGLIGHSYGALLPYAKYGQEHPEYFAFRNGRRVTAAAGGGPQPCVTNPDVLDIVTSQVLKQLEANPQSHNVVVSQNDNGEYCQCETCEVINQREESPMGANLAFVNAVAERVTEKHPDVMVGTLAYSYTRKPPKYLKPHPNVQIQLCSIECCTFHPLSDPDCERNPEFTADLLGWKEKTTNIWMWNYNTNFFNFDLPFPNLRAIGENVRLFADSNIRGVFMQANGGSLAGEMSDLRNYVMSRCLWRPGLDSWELAEEFCRLHYREAAGPILEHLTLIHDNLDQKGLHPQCFPTAAAVGLTAEVAAQSMALFDEALASANSDAVRQRVEKASICAYKATIATNSAFRFEDGLCKLDVPEATVQRYLDLLKQFNVTQVFEGKPIATFTTDLKQLSEGMPGLQIENDFWRLAVIPELMGRVVTLEHRPTGRNLIFGRNRAFNRSRGIEVWGREGYKEDTPRPFTGKVVDNTVHLAKTLPDSSEMERMISFVDGDTPRVRIATTIRQAQDSTRAYQLHEHPEYDIHSQSRDEGVISLYLKKTQWEQVTDFHKREKQPGGLKLGEGNTGVAFFNHELGYGAMQTFDAADFESPNFFWSPERYEVNLEVSTTRFELKPGESHSFAFEISYLDQPPSE